MGSLKILNKKFRNKIILYDIYYIIIILLIIIISFLIFLIFKLNFFRGTYVLKESKLVYIFFGISCGFRYL